MAGNHEVVPYIPFDPNQCTGGGGIIGGHVYDDYIHDLSIYKLKVYPGLTFVNVVVEWETDNYDFDVNNLNVSCYTHNYGVLEYGTPNYDNGTNGDFIYIKKQSENTPQYNAGQQMADIEGTEYMGNAFVDELGNTYICTQNGKIIKKNKNKEIIIYSEKYQENICCIDIFDNIIVTGDDTGNIIIWKNDKINQALINIGNKNEILCIKIITYIENSKLILIFSDSKGDLSLVDVNPNKIAEYTQNSILNQEEMPIYNINLYLRQKSDISKDKENIILVIASSQSAGIYNCNLETLKLNALKEFEYTYGEKGKFTFDISIGQGFPPVADLKKENQEIAALARGSILGLMKKMY